MLDDDDRIRYMMESVEVMERKSMPRLILSREFSHCAGEVPCLQIGPRDIEHLASLSHR
jgi:hypothetical protein